MLRFDKLVLKVYVYTGVDSLFCAFLISETRFPGQSHLLFPRNNIKKISIQKYLPVYNKCTRAVVMYIYIYKIHFLQWKLGNTSQCSDVRKCHPLYNIGGTWALVIYIELNQIKSNQIKSNQSNQINQIESNQIKSNQIKPYLIKSYPIPSHPISSHHITSHHITSHHITSYHIIPYHMYNYFSGNWARLPSIQM